MSCSLFSNHYLKHVIRSSEPDITDGRTYVLYIIQTILVSSTRTLPLPLPLDD